MKTKTLKKNKVNVITLGCSKNTFDSEVLMAQLKANKFDVEHESMSDDAEIVIINTCGFIDNAKQESIDTILRYAQAKNDGEVDKVYVTGCLSERYREDLENEIMIKYLTDIYKLLNEKKNNSSFISDFSNINIATVYLIIIIIKVK